MKSIPIGSLDRFLRIERPVADTAIDGAGSGNWEKVADVWANVQDVLPSRGERQAEGINMAARPARVRMHYRSDVTAAMRFVLGATVDGETVDCSSARIMQIVSGPAELGRRQGVEFMVEDYSPAGNTA
jgi:head-tail adaptor